LELIVPESKLQLSLVMIADKLEEVVLNIDASPQVSVIIELSLVDCTKLNPALSFFESVVSFLNWSETDQQWFLQL